MKAKLLRILSVCAAAVIASVTLCSCGNSGVTVDEKHFKGPPSAKSSASILTSLTTASSTATRSPE